MTNGRTSPTSNEATLVTTAAQSTIHPNSTKSVQHYTTSTPVVTSMAALLWRVIDVLWNSSRHFFSDV